MVAIRIGTGRSRAKQGNAKGAGFFVVAHYGHGIPLYWWARVATRYNPNEPSYVHHFGFGQGRAFPNHSFPQGWNDC
jgi:hypothetical protein